MPPDIRTVTQYVDMQQGILIEYFPFTKMNESREHTSSAHAMKCTRECAFQPSRNRLFFHRANFFIQSESYTASLAAENSISNSCVFQLLGDILTTVFHSGS